MKTILRRLLLGSPVLVFAVFFIPAGVAWADPPNQSHLVRPGDTLIQIAAKYKRSVQAVAQANRIANPNRIYAGQRLVIPSTNTAPASPAPNAPAPPAPAPGKPAPVAQVPNAGTPLAPSATGKSILVDLSEQRLWAYENGTMLRTTLVSTGLPQYPTVVGTFPIWIKMRYDRMVGPGYDLPNVPYVMYFYRGYGLHGTYWHHNFGHPMSHGCVNLPTPEAEWLFNWAQVGTPVTVVP